MEFLRQKSFATIDLDRVRWEFDADSRSLNVAGWVSKVGNPEPYFRAANEAAKRFGLQDGAVRTDIASGMPSAPEGRTEFQEFQIGMAGIKRTRTAHDIIAFMKYRVMELQGEAQRSQPKFTMQDALRSIGTLVSDPGGELKVTHP